MNYNIDTKQRIVKSASNLFYKNGYNNTNIKDILSDASVNKETFNEHFKSKEDICIAHLRYMNSEFSNQLLAFIQQTPKGNKRVLAVFNYLEFFYKMENFNGCWNIKIFSEVSNKNGLIYSEVLSQKKGLLNYIDLLIQENIQLNNQEDYKKLAQQIYLLLESAVAQSNILKEEWPITEAKALCSNLIEEACINKCSN
jgi:AcrR family transcriptional regulator